MAASQEVAAPTDTAQSLIAIEQQVG